MGAFRFIDLKPSPDSFLEAVVRGLESHPKRLNAKFFYDEAGSRLFEAITQLPEYYPTRTEKKILADIAPELKKLIPMNATLIEFGAGAAEKVRILLDGIGRFAAYVPIDISRDYLEREAALLSSEREGLAVTAICADYTKPLALPPEITTGKTCVGFFPGSTIGNMTREDAKKFLVHAAALLGRGAGFIIGVDLKKDPAILHAAYNDRKGVTAAFNKNILVRINRELGGDFDLAAFRHRAFYNTMEGRIEMHLESLMEQEAHLDGRAFRFRKGETIHTENSCKYNVADFRALAHDAGLTPVHAWWDDEWLFSVHYLKV